MSITAQTPMKFTDLCILEEICQRLEQRDAYNAEKAHLQQQIYLFVADNLAEVSATAVKLSILQTAT